MADIDKSSTTQVESRVEEPFPDLSENTPLIQGSTDVIEHSKNQPSYLVQTDSPSDGGDIRWYYSKVPLADSELAASVPRSEIVGKKDYIRFGVRDSLAIEAFFLQRDEEFLSNWWKEFAECQQGPRVQANPSKKMDKCTYACSSDDAPLAQSKKEEERIGIPVKGGLYEVDLMKRHCFPVYWSGENLRVLRGHWFAFKGGHWLPLREDIAEQLEFAYSNKVWHRRTFQESGLFAARVELHGASQGLHVLFTGEDDSWEAWLNVDTSGFSSVLGLGRNGIKLRRGYMASLLDKPTQDELHQQKEEEMDDHYSQVPVRHLVFMVHGIGQRLEKSNLVDDVSDFRHVSEILAQRHLTLYQRCAQRVLFIPCQWRKGLKLSSEAAVNKITLDGLRGLRVMLSATVHDVLYYMSPIHCQDIIDSVSNQLNRLYLKFLMRNPGYDGKVSIYGHSLGSVLSYDILCHQEMKKSSPYLVKPSFKECGIAKSSFDMYYQSLVGNFTAAGANVGCAITDEIIGTTCPIDESMVSSQSTILLHEKGQVDEMSTKMGVVESHFNTSTAVEESAVQATEEKETDELSQGHMFAKERDRSQEDSNTSSILPGYQMQKMAKEECEDGINNDNKIKFLMQEIDFLNAKIAELEGQCSKRHVNESMPLQEYLSPSVDDELKSSMPSIKYPKLEFKVDTFFAVGSPLGLFLALRNVHIGIGKGQRYWEGGNILEEMPACRQMLNIFHPFDPVAYRVEPLVCKEYVSKRPVIIPYHKGGRRLHIWFQEIAEDVATRSRAAKDRFNSVRDKVLAACQPRDSEGAENIEQREEKSYGCIMMERLTGVEGRMDHMLQDKTLEHQYLQAMGSHTNYWRDYDTALFILRHLYQDISEEPLRYAESYEGIKRGLYN